MSTDAKPEPFEVYYDGLSDEQGLIPAFGPVRLDDQGRIVMSEEERRAQMPRRPSAAFKAIELASRRRPARDRGRVHAQLR